MKKILSKFFIIFFVLATSFYTFASDDKKFIYTPGHPSPTIMAETFFPDRINLRRPGAEGIILWNSFLSDQKDALSVQTFTSTHILSLSGHNFLEQSKLIAVLATSDMMLFTHKSDGIKTIEDFRGKELRVSSVYNNGVCSLIMRQLSQKTGIKFVIIPYNTAQQSYVDFLGKHVDAICTSGSVAHLISVDDKFHLVSNLSEQYGFHQSIYLYGKKDMSDEEERRIIQTIIENRKNIDKDLFAKNSLKEKIFFGKDAQKIFDEDRKNASILFKFIER
jgi:ABC-type amino acid transport substrate-binding protein